MNIQFIKVRRRTLDFFKQSIYQNHLVLDSYACINILVNSAAIYCEVLQKFVCLSHNYTLEKRIFIASHFKRFLFALFRISLWWIEQHSYLLEWQKWNGLETGFSILYHTELHHRKIYFQFIAFFSVLESDK